MKLTSKVGAWALLLLALMLALIACGPAETTSEEDEETPAEIATTESAATAGEEQEAAIASSPLGTTSSEIQYIEIEAGNGPAPETGDRVQVHYTGKLEDGTVFDTSVTRGVPFEFELGRGQVIRGWDQGIAMMREGGKATLIIPPELAYGTTGSGDRIPPNATLTFEVELVGVIKPPTPVEVASDAYESLDSGILYYDIEEGEGDALENNERISVHFMVWTMAGEFLADSREVNQPANYTLGSGQLFLNDWDDAVIGMKVGGKRQLIISPEVGGRAVPPGETLVFELEIMRRLEVMTRAEVEEGELVTTDSGLQYYDIVVGDGDEATAGSTVKVHYTGWFMDSEAQFDSTYERGEPIDFPLGSGVVIPGWDEGVTGMQVGGKRQLIIPPDLGFGEAGSSQIPPNSILVFEIELLEVTVGS